jgi:coenzyme F420-reducing hydrogenase alpha subunit
MSAVHAMEYAFEYTISPQIRELRRLLYCGEWIESHALHIFLLHAPDFLGFPDAMSMAKQHRDKVECGLRLKKIGNQIMSLLGGREIHPINVKVGGFYRSPAKGELTALVPGLRWARQAACETLDWAAGFSFPDIEFDYEFVSLSHAEEYPMNEGRIRSSQGLDLAIADMETAFEETHVAHSTALQASTRDGRIYLTGPMARFALNYDRLPKFLSQAASRVGIAEGCRNPYKSILVRALEVAYACDEALRIIETYERPQDDEVDINVRAATGYGATEAPRGLLYHRYNVSAEGMIQEARIIPPTSQNQRQVEADLKYILAQYLDLSDDELAYNSEKAIRNYDPCISCATHFLKVHLERG